MTRADRRLLPLPVHPQAPNRPIPTNLLHLILIPRRLRHLIRPLHLRRRRKLPHLVPKANGRHRFLDDQVRRTGRTVGV